MNFPSSLSRNSSRIKNSLCPEFSSGQDTFNQSSQDSAADKEYFSKTFIPISSPFFDVEHHNIQLWKSARSVICATVKDMHGQSMLIPQSRIVNPLRGSLKNFIESVSVDQYPQSRWALTFHRSSSSITVWPQIKAAGNSENPKPWKEGRIDEPHVAIPKNPNDRYHIFRGDGEHFPDTTAGHVQASTFMINNKNCMGFLCYRSGELVDAGGHYKTGYYKDLGDGTYLFGARRGREMVMGGRGCIANQKRRYVWVQDPKDPNRGYFARVNNPDYKGDDPGPGGSGGGKPKDPPPPKGPSTNPAKGGYVDRVQQNNLNKDHNALNPNDPIAKQGGESGEIGGVGLEGGLIEGLFDGLEASLQTEHLFFLPQIDEELPFSNEELQQLLRELSVGIFEHDALPFFSLHFNKEHHLYPVINPIYQNTLVGEVIAMLDYLMKGFLNGGYFEREKIDQWRDSGFDNGSASFIDLHNYCLQHKDLLPSGFEYASLTEIVDALQGAKPTDENDFEGIDLGLHDRSNFSSAFRIIAKQESIKRAENLFFLDGDFEVQYDFNVDALYQEHLNCYRSIHNTEPQAYIQIQLAYKKMADSIKTAMPRLPICAKYFKMLKVILFFSHYFKSLKANAKFPCLTAGVNDPKRQAPALFPSLPMRSKRDIATGFTVSDFYRSLDIDLRNRLVHFLKNHERGTTFPDSFVIEVGQAIKGNLQTKANSSSQSEDQELDALALKHHDSFSFAKRYLHHLIPFFQPTPDDCALFRENLNLLVSEQNKCLDYKTKICNHLRRVAQERECSVDSLSRWPSKFRNLFPELDKCDELHEKLIPQIDTWQTIANDPESVLKTDYDPNLEIHFTSLPDHMDQIEAEGYRSFVGGCGIDLKKIATAPTSLGLHLLNQNAHNLTNQPGCSWWRMKSSIAPGFAFALKLQNFFVGGDQDYLEPLAALTTFQEDVLEARDELTTYLQDSEAISLESAKRALLLLRGHKDQEAQVLFAVSEKSDEHSLRKLIELGIDLTLCDINGYSALHYALGAKSQVCATVLIEKCPDLLNVIANDGNSALMLAVQSGELSSVKQFSDLLNHQTANGAKQRGSRGSDNQFLDIYGKGLFKRGNARSVNCNLGNLLNLQTHNSMTPLACAVHRGFESITCELLQLRPDLEIGLEGGTTPLGLAAKGGNAKLVSELIKSGAKINAQNKGGFGPLHLAADAGHHEVVQILLDSAGINVNARLKTGKTALHLAAQKDHLQILQSLLNRGADQTLVSWDNESYFLTAIFHDSLRTAQFIIKDPQCHIQVGYKEHSYSLLTMPNLLGQDPASAAIAKHSIAIANLIDFSVNKQEPQSALTALSSLFTRWRLGPKGDRESEPIDRLRLICRLGTNLELLKQMLQHCEFTAQERTEALQIAARYGRERFMTHMQYECRVANDPDQRGRQTLHHAAQYDFSFFARATAHAQNSPEILRADRTGLTPLAIAAQFNSLNCLEILLKALHAKGPTLMQLRSRRHPLRVAIETGQIEAVEILIEELGDHDAILDNEGWRPIHVAAAVGNCELISHLLENGADLTLTENRGRSALQIAVIYKRSLAVKHLIDLGADLDVQHPLGSPLHSAVLFKCYEELNQLIKMGGDVFAKREDQKTPFDLAIECREPKYLALMLSSLGDLESDSSDRAEIVRRARLALNRLEQPFQSSQLRTTLLEIIKKDCWVSLLNLINQNRELTLVKGPGSNEAIGLECPLLHLIYLHAGTKAAKSKIFWEYIKQDMIDLNIADDENRTLAHLTAINGELISELKLDYSRCDHMGNSPLHYYALNRTASLYQGALKDLPSLLAQLSFAQMEMTNCKGQSPLHLAIRTSNTNLVNLLLTAGVDPNQRTLDEECKTPSIIAAECGNFDLIQSIIGAGGNVKLTDAQGNIALHAAVKSNSLDIARVLLQRSHKNAPNHLGLTPLHLAAILGNVEVLNFLAAHGEKTDLAVLAQRKTHIPPKVNFRGKTALELAALHGHLAIVRKLWDTQFFSDPINFEERRSNLAIASSRSKQLHNEMWSKLANVAEVTSYRDPSNRASNSTSPSSLGIEESVTWQWEKEDAWLNIHRNAVISALSCDQTDTLEEIIKRGWGLNLSLDSENNRPLHLAARLGSFRCAEWLLQRGALLGLKNQIQQTPLQIAIENGHAQLARRLIFLDENLDLAKLINQNQLLHRSVERDDLVMANLLLECDAALSCRDALGQTALELAVILQKTAMLRLLLVAGAEFSHSSSSRTERDLLGGNERLSQEMQHCTQICAQAEENGDSQIHLAIRLFDEPLLSATLRRMHPDQFNKNLETPLHLAVKLKQINAVRRLLASGADLEMRNMDDQTALQCAKEIKGNSDIVEMLLKCDPKSQSSSSEPSASSTPLQGDS